jgi:uncharacterized membrane protein/thiol-disulfide isomerase/thioredoxin
MTRRRQVPWIQQYSRLLIGSIAILGICVTAYLTWVKVSNNGVCGTQGCETVLASPFANVGSYPLTGLGLLSYVAVVFMAFAPMLVNPKTNKAAHTQLNQLTWVGLLLAGVSMAVFSCYLMYLLAFVIKAACPFCIASAIFTFAIFGLTLLGHEWEDLGQVVFMGIAAALASIVVSLIFYNSGMTVIASKAAEVAAAKAQAATVVNGEITTLAPTIAPIPGIGWKIQSTSGAAEVELAKHLTQKGVKMYSAYWCPHCYEQKQLFGQEAWNNVTNIECAADAKKNPQPEVCTKAGIKGFPTWIIDGKLETGVKRLADLGKLTSYGGATGFKYDKLFAR